MADTHTYTACLAVRLSEFSVDDAKAIGSLTAGLLPAIAAVNSRQQH